MLFLIVIAPYLSFCSSFVLVRGSRDNLLAVPIKKSRKESDPANVETIELDMLALSSWSKDCGLITDVPKRRNEKEHHPPGTSCLSNNSKVQ